MESLRKEIEQHGLKKLAVEPIARRADLHHIYNAQYRLLSEQVHCLPISLDPFLVENHEGGLDSFDWGPKHEGLDFILFTNIQMLFTALVPVTKFFSLDKCGELKKIDDALTALAPLLGKMTLHSKTDGN